MYMLSNLSLDYVIYLFERFMKIIDADPERDTERDRDRQTDREIEREKETERDREGVEGRGRGNDYCHFSDVYYVNIQPSCSRTKMEYFNIKIRLLIRET